MAKKWSGSGWFSSRHQLTEKEFTHAYKREGTLTIAYEWQSFERLCTEKDVSVVSSTVTQKNILEHSRVSWSCCFCFEGKIHVRQTNWLQAFSGKSKHGVSLTWEESNTKTQRETFWLCCSLVVVESSIFRRTFSCKAWNTLMTLDSQAVEILQAWQ